jgi:hypothetical protein
VNGEGRKPLSYFNNFFYLCIVIVLLLNLIIVHTNALIDYNLIKAKKYINHYVHSILYVLLISLVIVSWLYYEDKLTIYNVFSYQLACYSFRWIYFDLTLNKLRGLPLDYVSNKKKDNSHIDTLLYKYRHCQFPIKFVTLIISICLVK